MFYHIQRHRQHLLFKVELVKAEHQESGVSGARVTVLCWILIVLAAEFLFAFRKHKWPSGSFINTPKHQLLLCLLNKRVNLSLRKQNSPSD